MLNTEDLNLRSLSDICYLPISEIRCGCPFRLSPNSRGRIYYLGDKIGDSYQCYFVDSLVLTVIYIPNDAFVYKL